MISNQASRRSLLRGGALLGLSAVTCAACSARRPPRAAPATAAGLAGGLVLDYKPAQVTGWSPPYSPTLGGHTGHSDFTWHGAGYQVSLLSFGQAGDAPDPVYEDVPADPSVKFKATLDQAWGRYYAFRYLGGSEFTVESYGAWHGHLPGLARDKPTGIAVGADLYAVYRPGRGQGQPAVSSDLQFIQVLYYQIGTGQGDSQVDTGRANPFYGEGGGLTSVNGSQVVSFSDFIREGFNGKTLPPNYLVAEAFLAQDTGTKDAAGKDIVNVFGGIKWGWQMRRVS